MSRRIFVTIAVATLLLAAFPGGLLAKNAGSTQHYVEQIDFIWDGEGCPAVPEGLTIHLTGTLRGHLHMSTDANGVVHVNWGPDTARGTAVDSEGGTYRFNYHNMLIERDAGLPVEILVVDHFNLVGRGAAHGIRVEVLDDDAVLIECLKHGVRREW
jgi:hypothetical protein